MNVLNVRGNRNGLNGQFFEFAPLAPFLAPVAAPIVVSKARKARKTKYANIETQRLAEKYPLQDNSTDQSLILQQLLAESSTTLEQRNKSKGRKRAELTGRLRAFDEYIADYQKHLQLLKEEELKQPSKVATSSTLETPRIEQVSSQTSPTQTAPQDGVLGTSSVGNIGTTQQAFTPDTTEIQGMVQGATAKMGGKNTLLYVGLGVVALLIIVKLAKR
jgi:hypothetical protein